ncbi:hypothetical protein B0A49_07665 [Cryomyces minteri]|uniref:Uncharacterized protein n=1 Tax=Cryomyces minteri TaxID=331657 RepID=A0A4U0WZ94_9PEZI|nr:hypothetical protein B0A49_07665 [Cryomyces minteri]
MFLIEAVARWLRVNFDIFGPGTSVVVDTVINTNLFIELEIIGDMIRPGSRTAGRLFLRARLQTQLRSRNQHCSSTQPKTIESQQLLTHNLGAIPDDLMHPRAGEVNVSEQEIPPFLCERTKLSPHILVFYRGPDSAGVHLYRGGSRTDERGALASVHRTSFSFIVKDREEE